MQNTDITQREFEALAAEICNNNDIFEDFRSDVLMITKYDIIEDPDCLDAIFQVEYYPNENRIIIDDFSDEEIQNLSLSDLKEIILSAD